MPFFPDWLNITLIVIAALFLFVGVPRWLRGNERRENERSEDAERFWARYQPRWMSERLRGEQSQEYLEWLRDGRQKGYLQR